jgi:beta-glucosidase
MRRRILVAGPLADETNFMVSRYGPNGFSPRSIGRAIADYIGDDAEVTFARGCTTADATWPESEIYTSPLTKEESDEIAAAVVAAKEADLVVAVVGEDVFTTGESRSRTSLDLPGRQRLLVERLFETGRPVVVVLVNGQPLTVAWMDRRANAILETWFAGPFGGDAVAKMLFGEINPSGKTTVTFPKSIGQVEYNFPFKKGSHGGQPKFGPNGFGYTRVTGALYPFGHGLSYTTFGYANLVVSPNEVWAGDAMEVSCDVTNTGKVPGAEVVQFYARDLYSSVVTYDSVLRGFEKIHLQPGETRRVTFKVQSEDLAILDRNMRWTVEPGGFEIMVGASSEDIRLRQTIEILNNKDQTTRRQGK